MWECARLSAANAFGRPRSAGLALQPRRKALTVEASYLRCHSSGTCAGGRTCARPRPDRAGFYRSVTSRPSEEDESSLLWAHDRLQD